MIIEKRIAMVLPTVEYGNTPIEVRVSIDTDNERDMDFLGLSATQPHNPLGLAETSEALLKFVESEIFATKESLEQRPAKDFSLQTDFSSQNARNSSMKSRR